MQVLVSPLYVTLHSKRSAGKRISLNLNNYRNLHFQVSNKAKIAYKQLMIPQICSLHRLQWPVKIRYRYYLRQKCDVGNIHAIVDKFFLDALVELGKLPDDSIKFVVGASYTAAGIDRKNPRCEIEIMEGYAE